MHAWSGQYGQMTFVRQEITQHFTPPPTACLSSFDILGVGSGVYPGYRELELPRALQRAEPEDQGRERGGEQQPQISREHHPSLPEREHQWYSLVFCPFKMKKRFDGTKDKTSFAIKITRTVVI